MKLITSVPLFFFCCIFFTEYANAQTYVALSTGISKDINNTHKSFYHVPVLLQWEPFPNKENVIFFQFEYDHPLTAKGSGEAYTLNPSLPQKVTLVESVRPFVFTTSLGLSILVYTNKRINTFNLNLLLGYCYQNFKVTYKNYDKENYEVLDPDVNLNKNAFVLSMAGVYNFNKAKNMFLRIGVQTPLLISAGRYPLSYKYIAPLQLTYGYKLFYNKRK